MCFLSPRLPKQCENVPRYYLFHASRIIFTLIHGLVNVVPCGQVENVPKDILNKFVNSYNNTLRLNMLMAAELDRIVNARIASGGLPPLLLRFCLRPINDT